MILSKYYKYAFFLIVSFYCLILSQFGLENFDTGYMSSFSWRIVNGQNAYQDFIYKFPPVTIYFHAFFMNILPETGQFYFFRIISYLLFSLHVFFVIDGFDRLYNFKKMRIDKWGLMIVCYIISIHNFISCPWPTTDSLLFFSVAFWMVTRERVQNFWWFFGIAFFTVLSALSKQPFYLVPLLFLIWIFIKYDYKKALLFLMQIIINLLLFFIWIAQFLSFPNFVKQTTGETTLHQLYYSGIHNYIFIPVSILLILSMVLFFIIGIYFYFSKQNIKSLLPVLKWFSVILYGISILFYFFIDIKLASRIAFDASIILFLYVFFQRHKSYQFLFPIVVLLFIAWLTSISLGYPYPILFTTGIILSTLVLLNDEIKINPKYYFWLCLPFCILAFGSNSKPYREKNIFSLNYSLESVSPKLKFIKTNKENLEKHLDLKRLIAKYGKNYIVAPSLPLANYLFNTNSKLPGDWIINTEINRQYKTFIKKASKKENYIFLEKSFLNRKDFECEKIEDFSYVSYYIYSKFNKIEETNHFIIYNSLKKNEKLP
jgi:hypothetical protein